ncbi:MAG TPA: energy transducer TonB [Bryobacteraceae bacterium]|nr:energy transducer TonB [Bryobacteraceae bacterium]
MRAILLAMVAVLSLYATKPDPNYTEPPKLLERVAPEYTQAAREARVEGSVTLSGVIDVNGRFTDVLIVHPLSHGLGDKAIECVRKWRFKPAMQKGVAVPAKATVQINFRLL